MYDMVFRDVAVLPKMSSVYHWVEGRAALTSDMEKIREEIVGKSDGPPDRTPIRPSDFTPPNSCQCHPV